MAFTLDRDLLVAPAPTPESRRAYDVCAPDHGWFDCWTGARMVEKSKQRGCDGADAVPARSDDGEYRAALILSAGLMPNFRSG